MSLTANFAFVQYAKDICVNGLVIRKEGNYTLFNNTLTMKFDSANRIERFEVKGQNKRKLILQPIESVETNKIVFKCI